MNYNFESPTNEGKNLWSHLLEEVRENNSLKLSPQRCLFVLGESECGKTTIVSRLQGVEDINKSYGLEYQIIDVKDEDRDDQTKLGVYVLDSSPELLGLAKFALNEKSFADTIAVLVVSMHEPWKIMENLHNLYDTLCSHCRRLKLDEIDREEYKQSLIRHFQEYVEPQNLSSTDSSGGYQVSGHTASSRRHLNPLHPPLPSLAQPGLSSHPNDDSIVGMSLPLPENALKHNIGLPLVVVVTKTDVMDSLKKDHSFDDEHFEVIQMHVRKFCLERGAALFYTSVKEEKNCELLKKYIHHRIYGFPFMEQAYVVEKDCVFVPTGWDTEKKIRILEESLVALKTRSSDYEDCIPTPKRGSRVSSASATATGTGPRGDGLSSSMTGGSGSADVSATDEQRFLDGIRDEIEKSRKTMMSASGNVSSSNMGGGGDPYSSNRSPSSRNTAAVGQALKSRGYASAGVNTTQSQAGEGVLANFFNSLLKKTNSPNVAGTNTGPISTTASMKISDAASDSNHTDEGSDTDKQQQPTNGANQSDVQQSVNVS